MKLADRFEYGRLLTTKAIVDYYETCGHGYHGITKGRTQMNGWSISRAAEAEKLFPEALSAYIDAVEHLNGAASLPE